MQRLRREFIIWFWLILSCFPALSLLLHFSHSELSWCQWDCKLYANMLGNYQPSAFFPAWPILGNLFWKALSPLATITPETALLLFSILITLLAKRCLLMGVEKLTTGFRAPALSPLAFGYAYQTWLTIFLLSVFPHSFFWFAGYSEGLYVLLLATGLVFLPNHLRIGCSFIALTALVRPQGVWTMGALGLVCLSKGLSGKKLALVLLSLPFLIFCAWLYAKTGNPFYFVEAQRQWGHGFSLTKWALAHVPRFSLDFFMLCFSWLTFFKWRKRTFAFQFLALASLLSCEVPLFNNGFMSYTRFLSVNLALFISFAEVVRTFPWLCLLWLAYAIPQLAVKIATFCQGGWSG